MIELIATKVKEAVACCKAQENIDAIVEISNQYKDSESLSNISRPFDINFGAKTSLQDKFNLILSHLAKSSSYNRKKEPKILANQVGPIKPMHNSLAQEDCLSSPGSLDLELPEKSSLENSDGNFSDILSTAKLVYKLKNDPVSEENKEIKMTKKSFNVWDVHID